jgi:hypothetical protein
MQMQPKKTFYDIGRKGTIEERSVIDELKKSGEVRQQSFIDKIKFWNTSNPNVAQAAANDAAAAVSRLARDRTC